MNEHALLSASGAYRWMACTPSARLELEFDDQAGTAAEEGTAAHALAEHKLRKALKLRSRKPVSVYDSDEMDACTDDYAAFALEQIAQAKVNCSDPIVLIEQKLDFSKYVRDGFGTGDFVLIADKMLHIVDFKYGQGVLVAAEDNPQMKLYALGALELYDGIYDIDTVSMTIFQPRRENVSTYTVFKESLYQWAEEVLKPAAALAYEGKGEYCPGEHCQFCRAAVKCRARAESKMKLAAFEFALPPLLSDEDIEHILAKVDELVMWASDIKEYALQQAIGGKKWLGWKLVSGRSNRKYTNETIVADVVASAGYEPYERKVLGITAMQKLLGATKFEELLDKLVEKPPGKPTLVPSTDKRPELQMNTAQEDFSEA